MRSLLLVLCPSFALCTEGVAQAVLQDHSVIELRVARTSPAPGYTHRKSLGDTAFFLSDTVLVSDSDIEDAHAERTRDAGGSPLLVINVRLTAQADSRVAKSTRSHVGYHLAMFLDQQLVGAPPIVMEVGGRGDLQIECGPPAPLDRIGAAVAARWPDHH